MRVSTTEVGKQRLFKALAVGLGLVVALSLAEVGARLWERRIQRSESMDPDLFLYHPRLGWTMTPGWSGRHQHYDFSAEYHLHTDGFRKGTEDFDSADSAKPWAAVIGDSFTFGFGVADVETFSALLDESRARGMRFVNFGVPGYSTDQEALLSEERILREHPQLVLLMVYVGNDLFDNARAVPLQGNAQKPYFELSKGELELRNVPVPYGLTVATGAGTTLASVAFGDHARSISGWLSEYSAVARLAGLGERSDSLPDFSQRYAAVERLFAAILERASRQCDEAGAELLVGILAGRSFVERPGSLSERYQDYLRIRVGELCREKGIEQIDVAGRMRELRESQGSHSEEWYFPHEGHFTAAGHRVVAEILIRYLHREQ